ncbi:MAG: hypothetical protein E7633_01080 [Ruminococcaceae bacterium]|nr:hypothetical protein [Oscillospiraceae bacterium]
MTQSYFFKDAAWVGKKERTKSSFSVLRGHFEVENINKVSLNVLGLGFFKCYINGVCINPDTFLPLSSDFEASCDPAGEILAGHRIYVPQFDITPFVKVGDNVIALHFGGGWYTHKCRVFGLPKAVYCVSVECADETKYFVSDENCRIAGGYVSDYNFVTFETQNYSNWNDCFDENFDDSSWEYAVRCEALDSEYCATDCPADALIEELPIKKIGVGKAGIIYDCGQNTTGYPVLNITASAGENIKVVFSESILADGSALDMSHAHGQTFNVISDGKGRTVQPEFTWFGFRYFEVIGDAVPEYVKVIHADVPSASSFDCDNETLNWTYKTFIHTMLCNMHTGHPSDCPHIERRGYTGDGQLTCHAVLSVLDARAFYEKWMQDIGDCQDTLSGHIQYTAPYIRSGGGPGGWGSAIVEVPYQLYKHYGDKNILSKYYENMKRYIDYLEAHSEFNLVTSDKKGEWCLGDWCGPNILYPDRDITCGEQQMLLPAPMVNTYFMVKTLKKMSEIAHIIGKDEDIGIYKEKAEIRSDAIRGAYFNTFDGNFIMNVQGANAYAVDIGLGNEETYQNMVRYYSKLGYYDTGIFATDILTRVLFEKGNAELAVDLLMNNGLQGYEHWRRNGATTFHEYWDSNRSRSHNHPMFGAPIAYFFEYLLGIKQKEGTAGYKSLVIAPQATSKFGRMAGSMKTSGGDVSVSYTKEDDRIFFRIEIPSGTEATFVYSDKEYSLENGVNEIFIELCR